MNCYPLSRYHYYYSYLDFLLSFSTTGVPSTASNTWSAPTKQPTTPHTTAYFNTKTPTALWASSCLATSCQSLGLLSKQTSPRLARWCCRGLSSSCLGSTWCYERYLRRKASPTSLISNLHLSTSAFTQVRLGCRCGACMVL